MRIDLFVVDGQNDFLASGKEPSDWPWPAGGKQTGALYVTGADEEAMRVEKMINRLEDLKAPGGHRLAKVHATLDSHHRNDGSHHTSWKGQNGKCPPPFTVVSHQDVKGQKWVPRLRLGVWEGKPVTAYQWALNYTKALESQGRCPLCLWPEHCVIGTWGNCIYHPLARAYDRWCQVTGGWIDFITKGQWPFTEHYSGFRADVADPTRPETQLNTHVIEDIDQADRIAWVGWAGSHCLRWTALDAANHFGTGANAFMKKSVFFTDASAAVPDPPGGPKFGEWRKEFLDEVAKRGATVTTTDQFLV